MCVGLGIGQGLQPVASFNHQAKKYTRVKKGLIFTSIFGFAVVGVLSLISFCFSEQIIYLFQKSPDAIAIGAPALRYATVGLLFMPLSVPVNMLYQSIRKAGVASFLSILRSGMILIPVVMIGVYFWRLLGIQIAQPLADAITGLISIPFILHFLKRTPNDIPDE